MGDNRILQRCREWFSRIADRFTWLVLWTGAAAYALLLLDVIDNWRILIGLAILTLTGFVTLITGLWKSQDRIHRDLQATNLRVAEVYQSVHSLDSKLGEVVQSLPKDLLTSEDCFRDLNRELKHLQELNSKLECREKAEPITVRLLGLGLGRGKNYLKQVLEYPPISSALRFEVLVITEQWSAIAPRPMQRRLGKAGGPMRVKQWCADSTGAVEAVVHTMTTMGPSSPNVSLEIRRYSEWPVIHGVAIVYPVEIVYFTHCRWSHGQYESSLSMYRKIKDAPPDSDKANSAIVFCSLFQHLWESEDTKLVYPSPRETIESPPTG